MSKCHGCDVPKDNGEPYCEECDPDGELGRAIAEDPQGRTQLDKERRAAELKAELAQLEGKVN